MVEIFDNRLELRSTRRWEGSGTSIKPVARGQDRCDAATAVGTGRLSVATASAALLGSEEEHKTEELRLHPIAGDKSFSHSRTPLRGRGRRQASAISGDLVALLDGISRRGGLSTYGT